MLLFLPQSHQFSYKIHNTISISKKRGDIIAINHQSKNGSISFVDGSDCIENNIRWINIKEWIDNGSGKIINHFHPLYFCNQLNLGNDWIDNQRMVTISFLQSLCCTTHSSRKWSAGNTYLVTDEYDLPHSRPLFMVICFSFFTTHQLGHQLFIQFQQLVVASPIYYRFSSRFGGDDWHASSLLWK